MRHRLAWALYGMGHAWWWVFDRDPIGLRGPLYRVYNGLMTTAYRLQGDDPRGPWVLEPSTLGDSA